MKIRYICRQFPKIDDKVILIKKGPVESQPMNPGIDPSGEMVVGREYPVMDVLPYSGVPYLAISNKFGGSGWYIPCEQFKLVKSV